MWEPSQDRRTKNYALRGFDIYIYIYIYIYPVGKIKILQISTRFFETNEHRYDGMIGIYIQNYCTQLYVVR